MPTSSDLETRHLVAAFGDQLDVKAAAFDGFEGRDPPCAIFVRIWQSAATACTTSCWTILTIAAVLRPKSDLTR
jgi:hypothetical protein